MTSIEFLGHSGIAVRHGGRLLLCDPWMSPEGAYNASWFQYPAYPHRDLSPLTTPDAVYVSHEHLDHFDPWFLSQLPKSTTILTGRFHKRRCIRLLERLEFETVIQLADFEPHEIAPGFVVRIALPSFNCPPHWFDSCALIECGDLKIFNLNDCNLALPVEQIRSWAPDVLLAQASPAIWYPLTYTNYDPERKQELMRARRESAIDSFVTAAKSIRPKLAIPFAGPPCFFDPALEEHFTGADSMFPTAPVAAKRLGETTDVPAEVLKPGDRLHLDAHGHRVEREPAYADFDYERDRRSYVASHRQEKRAIVERVLDAIPPAAPGLIERLRDHFTPLIRRNPFFVARINMRVLFEATGAHGGAWVIDFRDEPHDEVVYEWNGEECRYRFRFEARSLDQVLRGDLSWEDLLLSLRFQARRNPDQYNQHLFTFFKMGDHAALQAIAQAELRSQSGDVDTFQLEVGDDTYEVQRFCPHAGSDLVDAEVVDGKIVCPGHHWHFDLASGACDESGYRIVCKKLPRVEKRTA
jgi:UDP-MurNAc hydroxylase